MGKKDVSTAQVEQADAAAATANARVSSAQQAIEVAVADLQVVDSQIADADPEAGAHGRQDAGVRRDLGQERRIGAIAAGTGEPMFTVIKDNAIELVAVVGNRYPEDQGQPAPT